MDKLNWRNLGEETDGVRGVKVQKSRPIRTQIHPEHTKHGGRRPHGGIQNRKQRNARQSQQYVTYSYIITEVLEKIRY